MQNQIKLVEVLDRQILGIGHDAESNTLAIQFKNWKGEPSSLYHYSNFTAEDFAAFKAAESIGKHFGQFIKPETVKYPYVKIEAKIEEKTA